MGHWVHTDKMVKKFSQVDWVCNEEQTRITTNLYCHHEKCFQCTKIVVFYTTKEHARKYNGICRIDLH